MSVLRSIVAAFSCFSSIPMPQVEWSDKNMRFMMAAFPLVGVVIGACVWLWAQLCGTVDIGPVLKAAGFTLLPILLSGAIHLDGFGDVLDAASSHTDPERRREIMKDPHVGMFAAIGVACYLLAYFALASEVGAHSVALACVPVVSRCCSGFATVSFAGSGHGGMLAAERESSSVQAVRVAVVVLLAATVAFLVWQDAAVGLSMVVVAVCVLVMVKLYADRQFGGMNGDIAGFFLQVAELAMLVAIVVVGKLV